MSYEEFRRRIDTARQILVGAVPSPAGQIDQITYALMYKFMNDRDDEAVALGGKRTYFIGDYAKYNWHELMKLGGQDQLILYRQALEGMTKNNNIPELFRSIYQNAFLPFNSPTVLHMFLNEIDKFSHGESDDIGDAYEYLLSITGSQGDVGQFRTPRHIIKFIVEAVNPTKDDKVLDPAVGTAGFLIAAYNHVKSQHDGKDEGGNANEEHRLTADEKKKIFHNYRGFDIDPTMVRTAKVNMYLHGFPTPDIINHDSLSSEDYWDDWYDVILANPPFMSPKGGIQPHKKFGISANRAEVLFVDYIASHLKPNGRAGIVVPEGIIFQSGKAYKELRKNLVENYLYAVVSLPAGVFNPYAGVKTSILLLDKKLAKERDEILFVKIENDGYSLGAQRRPIVGDQLPEALDLIDKFKAGEDPNSSLAHAVGRDQIAESGDYNLSGDRYKPEPLREDYDYELVNLGDIVDIIGGSTPLRSNDAFWSNGSIPWFTVDDIRQSGRHVYGTQKHITKKALDETSIKLVPKDSVLLCCTASVGEFAYTHIPLTTNQQFNALLVKNKEILLPEYLFWAVSDFKDKLEKMAGKTSFSFVSAGTLKKIKIPLPPLEIQREIVSELDGYQKIIDAAQTIAKTYKPSIKIKPEWGTDNLGDLVKWSSGDFLPAAKQAGGEYPVYGGNGINGHHDQFNVDKPVIAIGRVGAYCGAVHYIDKKSWVTDNALYTKEIKGELDIKYFEIILRQLNLNQYAKAGGQPSISRGSIEQVAIPLPPIEIQREIVAELEAEQKLIEANKKLIEIYQQKIKSKIAEVWGE